jgi:protocatechuate 3,4-dioxygenase beta subunit
MSSDDATIGRILTRREVLGLLGASGAAILGRHIPGRPARSAVPACVVRPQQTLGPYFVDEKLHRSDIRTDPATGAARTGAPLEVTFNVSRMDGASCSPLAGAQVDLWQCDAEGIYSDVQDPSFNTVGQQFLRGYQLTDAEGRARFTTIYPGWYRGRTVHLHFRIRSDPSAERGHEFVSQLYFDDTLTDQVFRRAPYSARGPRTTRNAGDGIFRRGGEQLLLAVSEDAGGYAGDFDIGLQLA